MDSACETFASFRLGGASCAQSDAESAPPCGLREGTLHEAVHGISVCNTSKILEGWCPSLANCPKTALLRSAPQSAPSTLKYSNVLGHDTNGLLLLLLRCHCAVALLLLNRIPLDFHVSVHLAFHIGCGRESFVRPRSLCPNLLLPKQSASCPCVQSLMQSHEQRSSLLRKCPSHSVHGCTPDRAAGQCDRPGPLAVRCSGGCWGPSSGDLGKQTCVRAIAHTETHTIAVAATPLLFRMIPSPPIYNASI